jgi:hypothetical protein
VALENAGLNPKNELKDEDLNDKRNVAYFWYFEYFRTSQNSRMG